MQDIPAPTVPRDDPDRSVSCQEAIHLAFGELAARAANAGWKDDEVASALVDLADAHALSLLDNSKVCLLLGYLPK